MRKYLLLLLFGLIVASGASADVDTRQQSHNSKRQEARQAFIERVEQHAQTQKAQPQHQPWRERQAQPESNAVPKFKFPHKKATEKSKASAPATLKGFSQSELDAQKEILKTEPYKATVVTKAPNRTPEVIEDQPEGELVKYNHALSVYSFSSQEVISGTIESSIVYAPDGVTVYIKKIFGGDPADGWVRGTISGNKITIPLEQYTYYSSYYGWYKKLIWGTTTRDESDNIVFVQDSNVTEATFTIDSNGVITLDNSSAGNNGEGASGLAAVDEEGCVYSLEWDSEYTPIIPIVTPEVITEQPEGEVVKYENNVEGLFYRTGDLEPISDSRKTEIVYDPDGETVYFYNMFTNSWMRGTINGNKIIVPMGQYMLYDTSELMGLYLVWGTSAKQPDGSYTFTPDPAVPQATYTIDGDRITLDNAHGNVDGATGWAIVADSDIGEEFFYIEWTDQYTRFDIPTVIYEQPEGRLMTYERYGYYVAKYDEPWSFSSKVNIVFAPDGETVYIQDLVDDYDGAWMRGSIAGGKIHVPLGQYTYYYEEEGFGTRLAWGTTTRTPEGGNGLFDFTPDLNATEVTYTIDGERIIMDNSSAGDNGDGAIGLALVWDNDIPSFIMAYNDVFLAPISTEFISYQPDGILSLYEKSSRMVNYDGEEKQQTDVVPIIYAPDGETVYMGDGNSSWLKGSIHNNKISIPTRQCTYYNYSSDSGSLMVWGTYRWDENNQRYIFEYDPMVSEVTYTIDGSRIIMDNCVESADGLSRTGMAIVYSRNYQDFDYFEWNTVYTPFEEPSVTWDQPEGEVVYYDHAIDGTYLYDQGALNGTYATKMVYAPDGNTVYICEPLPFLHLGSWVRGTIDGNKIHVPLGQYLAYYEEDYLGEYMAFGTAVMNDEGHLVLVQDPNVTEVTYTIHDNGTITLDNTSAGDGSHNGAMGLIDRYDDGEDGNCMIWTSEYTPVEMPTIIDLMPEGILMVYNRTGRANRQGNVVDQTTPIKMVYDADGETVYLQNVAYGTTFNTWIRGTKSGGKIHVPLGQYIYYDNDARIGCNITAGCVAMVNGRPTFTPAPDVTEVTYSINSTDGTISMDNTNGGPNDDGVDGLGLCAVYTYGDFQSMEWNTVLTPDPNPVVITDQPQGTYKKYFSSFHSYDNNFANKYYQNGITEIVYSETSNTVYLRGIIPATGGVAWVKGTVEGNKIHVPMGQCIYCDNEQGYIEKLMWVYASADEGNLNVALHPDNEITEATFTISGDKITLDSNHQWSDGYNQQDGLGISTYRRGGALKYTNYLYLTAEYIPYFEPKVIDERPRGSLVIYNRRGSAIDHCSMLWKGYNTGYPSVSPLELSLQGGKSYVVYDPDGRTVYLFDPVQCKTNAHPARNTWVMGTLSEDGHKIIVPLDQYISWDRSTYTALRLGWGTSHYREQECYNYEEIYVEPDNSVMTATYTIQDGCISMDNSSGVHPTIVDYETWRPPTYISGNTGLTVTDQFGHWAGEMNWGTTYAGDHPAVPMDPVIEYWQDNGDENGNSALLTTFEATDVDGYGLEESGYSYSIYTDRGKLFTFEASKYGLQEDVTEVTYDMWQDNYKLRPNFVRFYRTNAEGFEPFFNWRIGIQLHYTCNGVKQSSNIVYLEVFDEPDEPSMPGDVNGDNNVTIGDATMLISAILSNQDLSNNPNADLNNDGFVTIADVTMLIRLILQHGN